VTPRSALPLRHRDLECHEAPPHRTPSALLVVAVLLASCGGAQVAPSPRPPFPSEALGFRFSASYEEAHAECADSWYAQPPVPAYAPQRQPATRRAYCRLGQPEIWVDLEGEPLRVADLTQEWSGEDVADAPLVFDRVGRDVAARFGEPTTTSAQRLEWSMDGGRILVLRDGRSWCANAPAWWVLLVYSADR